MNWLQKILNYFKKGHTPFISLIRDTFGRGIISREKAFIESSKGWVFACVNVIGQEIGNIQIKLMRGKAEDDEEDEEIFDHPALDAIFRANSQMTKNELFEITSAHLDLDGNSFWYLLKNEAGEVVEIYPMRPDRVTEILDEDEPLRVKAYSYAQEAGGIIEIKAEDIIPFRNIHPAGRYPFPTRGMGVVEPSASIIDTDTSARDWNRNFFENSAMPRGIFTYEGDLDSAEMERLQRQWEINHQGVKKASKTAFLKGGLKYQEVGTSQRDMDFIEGRRFSRDEILAMFRVPKSILGITEDVNRANAEASNFIFGLRVLKPRMQKIIDTLNEFYLPLFEDSDDLFFTFESPVPEDRASILSEYSLGINKWLTRNDIRRREGLGDTDEGDTFFGPFSELPQDRVKSLKLKPKLTLKKLKKVETKKSAFKFTSQMAQDRFARIWVKSINVNAERLRRDIDAYFKRQEKDVIGKLETEVQGLETKEYKLKQIEAFFDHDAEVQATIDLLTPFQRDFAKDASAQALLLTSTEPKEIDFDSPAFQKFFDERSKLFADQVVTTTEGRLEKIIAEGFERGESIPEISERVAGFFKKERDFRTDRIARTEVSAISNFAATESYKQAGIEKIQWLVAFPEDVDCVGNTNVVRNIGDPFPSGHVQPPAHPNCVCATIPVIE